MLGTFLIMVVHIIALNSIFVILIQVDTGIARYMASGIFAAQEIVANLDLIGVP